MPGCLVWIDSISIKKEMLVTDLCNVAESHVQLMIMLECSADMIQQSSEITGEVAQFKPSPVPLKHLEFDPVAAALFTSAYCRTDLEDTVTVLRDQRLHGIFRGGLQKMAWFTDCPDAVKVYLNRTGLPK